MLGNYICDILLEILIDFKVLFNSLCFDIYNLELKTNKLFRLSEV